MKTHLHEQVSKAIADSMFQDMQNPEFRGRAFTWDKFPTMVKGMVEANLFLYYKKTPADLEALKEQAGRHAFDYASALVAENQHILS